MYLQGCDYTPQKNKKGVKCLRIKAFSKNFRNDTPKNKNCIASEDCSVTTPHGTITGKKCPIGNRMYHNTIVDRAVMIANSGVLKAGAYKGVLGQDTLSLSSCPTQGYGGNVKFVFKTNKKTKPMCYYEWEGENKIADKGISAEAAQPANGESVGTNRVRGKYGVNLSMYKRECEYVSHEDIPLKKNLEKIEYWIPWKIEKYSYSHNCKGSMPGYANVEPGDERAIKVLKEQIETVSAKANQLGVPFEVKSCFSALKARWGDSYIPLTKENLGKFAQGITPEVVDGKIPQKCYC